MNQLKAPLNESEIRQAVRVVKRQAGFDASAWFETISLDESGHYSDSSMGQRAGFMYKHLWVTRSAADELYPAGWFPNQHAGGDGLPRWTQADRAIDNHDIVLWHTLNYHHWPRPEDWPVQPVVYASFHLMPDGFFDENPTMDVPRR